MKRLMFAALLSAFAFAATAQTTAAQLDAQVEAKASVPAVAEVDAQADSRLAAKTEQRKHDPNCLRHTGSRLQPRGKDGCIGGAGRSYSRDDLDRTGEVDVGEALRKLDPRLY
ncbi:hypothetical protein [Lysobacter antibioticus]|uniref:hypothetical protein n=1 Tax=Lysobacter antibioticus TaxID=84531 RepID=UPI000690A56D|nr:hypothetical protein [Lysobacter antibioticus]